MPPSRNFKIKLAAALGLSIAAAFVWLRPSGQGSISFDPAFYAAEGFVVGQAVASAVPGGGLVVVWHHEARNGWPAKMRAARMKGMKEALKDGPFSTQNEFVMAADPGRVDFIETDECVRLLDLHPGAAAVISFAGPPVFEELPGAKTGTPFFCGQIGYEAEAIARANVDDGRLRAYVIRTPKAQMDVAPDRTMTHDEVFALRYDLVQAGGHSGE